MYVDNITDINELRDLLNSQMVCLKETIETPTRTYNKGEQFFFTQDDKGVFLYDNDSWTGLELTFEEADKYIMNAYSFFEIMRSNRNED